MTTRGRLGHNGRALRGGGRRASVGDDQRRTQKRPPDPVTGCGGLRHHGDRRSHMANDDKSRKIGDICQRWAAGERNGHAGAQAAAACGISRATFYRRVSRLRDGAPRHSINDTIKALMQERATLAERVGEIDARVMDLLAIMYGVR